MMGLTAEQRQAFDDQGYLLVPGVLDEQELAPLRPVIAGAVDQRARQLHDEGKIPELYEDAPFHQRLVKILGPGRSSNWNPQVFSREVYELLTRAKILDIVESLIGPEITANGDYWVRFKMPGGKRSIFPWHQDSGYYDSSIDPDQPVTPTAEIPILTVWIPLVNVDQQNGPLQMVSGSHKHGLRPARRNQEGRLVPCEDVEQLGTIETLCMRVGDVVVFGNLTFHRSIENNSDGIRWSIDLRYSPTGSPLEWLLKKWPGFVARSRKHPETVGSWEAWQNDRLSAGIT